MSTAPARSIVGFVSGKWATVVRDNFNVVDYGATGDGSTDDTTAVQAALTAAAAAGGGVVWFPPGTYNLTSNIGLTSATGVILRGASRSSVTIKDARADSSTGAPDGTFYGLISFVTCTGCGIENLTLYGSSAAASGLTNTAQLGRKGTFFRGCTSSWVSGCAATYFRDEAIFADSDCPNWNVTGCWVHDTNSNGINLNSNPATQSAGSSISNNYIADSGQSAIIISGKSFAVVGNRVSRANASLAVAGDIIVLDCGAQFLFEGNTVANCDISSTSVAGLHVFGTAGAASSGIIKGNVFSDVKGDFDDWAAAGSGGVVRLTNCLGNFSVEGNTFNNCGRVYAQDGVAILIRGANTGRVHVHGNTVLVGSRNVDIGLMVWDTVPDNTVTVGPNDFAALGQPYFFARGHGSVTQSGGGPAVTPYSPANADYSFVMEVTTGGVLGVGVCRISFDGGTTWSITGQTIQSALSLTGTDVYLTCAAGTYVLGETYSWSTTAAPIVDNAITPVPGVQAFVLTRGLGA